MNNVNLHSLGNELAKLSEHVQHLSTLAGGLYLENKTQQLYPSPCEGDTDMARKKFNFTLPDGNNVWTTGDTISDAFANAIIKYSPLFTAQPNPSTESVTLRDFIENSYCPVYFTSLKPSTLESYRQFLTLNIYPFFGDMRMDEITVTTVQNFYNWMATASQHGRKKDMNADTIKRVGGFLGKIFRVAVEMGVVQSSPVKNAILKNPGKSANHHKAIPSDEMNRIKKAIPTLSNERDRLYVALLAYTGMRPEEVLGLRWEHIHLDDPNKAYCCVERTVTYTGRKKATTISDTAKTQTSIRPIPLPLPAVHILQTASCKEGYVLGGESPMCYSTHQRTCNHAFTELGIKGKYSSYDFRTTYGTELCEAGLTSKQVGDLMGHADTQMVETVYARHREEGILKHLDFLNTLNSAYVN